MTKYCTVGLNNMQKNDYFEDMRYNCNGNFFLLKIYKNDDDMISAGVCTKQACFLMSMI